MHIPQQIYSISYELPTVTICNVTKLFQNPFAVSGSRNRTCNGLPTRIRTLFRSNSPGKFQRGGCTKKGGKEKKKHAKPIAAVGQKRREEERGQRRNSAGEEFIFIDGRQGSGGGDGKKRGRAESKGDWGDLLLRRK
eukprot:1076641-Amorphochlora_amoeboformis.AAC.1